MRYAEKLKDPRWQKKRLEILQRDNWKCQCCGSEKGTLHAHHIIYEENLEPWEYDNHKIRTYCESCHKCWHKIDNLDKLTFLCLAIKAVGNKAINDSFSNGRDGLYSFCHLAIVDLNYIVNEWGKTQHSKRWFITSELVALKKYILP